MRAPLAWPAAGIVAGILLSEAGLPNAAWVALGFAAAVAAFRKRDSLRVAAPLLLLAGAAVGALRARQSEAASAHAAADAGLKAGVITVEGEVLDRMEDGPPLRVRWRMRLPGGALLSATLSGEAPGLPGERVRMTGLLRPPRPASNPGGFDSVAWARREGIAGTLVLGGPSAVVPMGPAPGAMAASRRLRQRLWDRLRSAYGDEDACVLGALLLGIREPLDEGLSDAFLETGTVHYLSISGAHVLLALGAVAWALTWTPLGYRTRAAVLMAAALGYAAVVGMQAPVLRAALAACLAAGAVLLNRPRAGLNAVAAAAAAIAIADPAQAHRAGFQLSFLAVTGILLLTRAFSERLARVLPGHPGKSPAARYLREGMAVSLAAWLSVLPLVARQCHLVTPVVLPANLVVFPLVAAAMAGGALGLLVPALAAPGHLALAALRACVEGLASVPGGHAYVAGAPAWFVAGWYAWLGLLALTAAGKVRLGFPRTCLPGAALAAAAAACGVPRAPARWQAAMIDVGQGLCVVVRGPGGTLLYDCGAYGRPEAGARVMAPALWALGVRRLDTVVISHGHDDHFNGLPALARRFSVGAVVREARTGDRFDLGGGAFAEVRHPSSRRDMPENDASICLRARLPCPGRRARASAWLGEEADLPCPDGWADLLLTGDLEDFGTALLLAPPGDLSAEVLAAPHHGGRLGPAAALLARTRPAEAWVSAREGFPSPGTTAALASGGVRARETWREGCLLLEPVP